MPDLVEPIVPAGRLRGLPQPVLDVDELSLRAWRTSDAPDVSRAYQDPDIGRWHLRSMDLAEAEEWVASREQRWQQEAGADWAVCAGGRLVGRVGLRTLDLQEGSAEAAYWVLAAARGSGVASRSLSTMASWLFAEVGLHRIELRHSTANVPSCRVADRAGFTVEGVLREEAMHADGWHDMHLHARLRDDPAP